MDVRHELISRDRPEATPDEPPPAVKLPADVRSLSIAVLTAIVVVAALRLAQALLIPLVIGLLIAYALNPFVAQLGRLRLPRALAAAVVLLVVMGLVGFGAYALKDEAASAVRQLPQAAHRLRQSVRWASRTEANPVESLQRAAGVLETAAVEATEPSAAARGVMRVQVVEPPLRLRDYVWWGSVGAVTFVGQIVLLLFLVYFLLASGDLYKRKLVKIAGRSLSKRNVTIQILDDINRQIEHFLLHMALASAIVGVTTWLAFVWLGMEQAAIWGIAAGICNTIPYFGPMLVFGGSAVFALVQFGSPQMAALVSGVSLAITTLEGYLLTPWLMSRATHMNGVAVFVGLLFWGWLWGVWGVLLAVPLMILVKTVADRFEDFQALGELLGE